MSDPITSIHDILQPGHVIRPVREGTTSARVYEFGRWPDGERFVLVADILTGRKRRVAWSSLGIYEVV